MWYFVGSSDVFVVYWFSDWSSIAGDSSTIRCTDIVMNSSNDSSCCRTKPFSSKYAVMMVQHDSCHASVWKNSLKTQNITWQKIISNTSKFQVKWLPVNVSRVRQKWMWRKSNLFDQNYFWNRNFGRRFGKYKFFIWIETFEGTTTSETPLWLTLISFSSPKLPSSSSP